MSISEKQRSEEFQAIQNLKSALENLSAAHQLPGTSITAKKDLEEVKAAEQELKSAQAEIDRICDEIRNETRK